MRFFTIVFATLACAMCVACDPIPSTLNMEEIETSLVTSSLVKQLESDIKHHVDGEMKNTANLYLGEDVDGAMKKTSLTDDEHTSGKREARQVVITANLPYVFYPYGYYPSVYTAARVNYYSAAIFPFLGI